MYARRNIIVIPYLLFCPLPLPYPRFGLHGFGFLAPLLPPFIPTPFPLPSLGLFSPLGFRSADIKSRLLLEAIARLKYTAIKQFNWCLKMHTLLNQASFRSLIFNSIFLETCRTRGGDNPLSIGEYASLLVKSTSKW
jgi:hypothetical protein